VQAARRCIGKPFVSDECRVSSVDFGRPGPVGKSKIELRNSALTGDPEETGGPFDAVAGIRRGHTRRA
jgi:hypothetical protein